MKEGVQGNKLLKAVDYRKWAFCWLIKLDPGLAERGFDWPLFLVTLSQIIMALCPLVSIFMTDQAKLRMDNVRCFLLEGMGVLVLLNEYTNRRNLDRLFRFLNEFMSSPIAQNPEARAILERATKSSHDLLTIFCRGFAVNFCAMMISQPLSESLQGNSWKKLPYPWVFPPCDTELSFWLVWLFQTPSLVISHFLGLVVMSFSSITVQITALFDVLLLSINGLEKKAVAEHQKGEASNYSSSLFSGLYSNVAFHQQLFREVVSATPHLRNTFVTLSLAISMVMACEAYPLVLNTEVFEALYNTPWYHAGVKYKKLLLTALTNSRRPMYIKSRIFLDMNATMSTFYSFVVSSYNLLNFIRKMN